MHVLGDMPAFIVLRSKQTGGKLMQLMFGALDLSKCNAVLQVDGSDLRQAGYVPDVFG